MRTLFFLVTIIFAVISGCKSDNPTHTPATGEVIYHNGRIYTVNKSQPWVEAMLVDGKIIKAIGSLTEVEKAATEDVVYVNLKGNMVMPGIHDVHLHPLEAASENFLFTLDEASDAMDYVPQIEKAEHQNTDAKWLLGWGFDLHVLLKNSKAPIKILDEISSSRPIAVMELTSHSIWVNSKALEIAGITKDTKDPVGGILMKSDDGNLNGLLIENAGNEIIDLALESLPNTEQTDYEGLVEYALPELAKNGITSVCDARTYWKRNHHMVWKRVMNDNKLTARVNLGLWIYPSDLDEDQILKISKLYTNDSNSLLKINQIKLYSDGIVINTTSAMKDDFKLDLFKKSINNGLNYIDQARLANLITQLEPIGFDFHIHAIGDRGVTESLNAIALSGNAKGRHRLTHVEYVNPSDYSRFKTLNVTADAQVAGDFTKPEFWHDNDQYVNSTLNNSIIPIKSLNDAGARLTLSSDWDVSELNPFIGIQNAVTRSPQNISLAEAIMAYTINAAYVMRQEKKVGSLETGKEADFIILNQNVFDIDVSEIKYTKVLETYLQGNRIY